jgi:hypothetical protein
LSAFLRSVEDAEDHDLRVARINAIDDDVRELQDKQLPRSGSGTAATEAWEALQLAYGLNDPRARTLCRRFVVAGYVLPDAAKMIATLG